MNFKFINGAVLLIGLGLIGYSQFEKKQSRLDPKTSQPVVNKRNYEEWEVKPGSIYDGDTLRLINNNQELKIRLCGIDAPEKEMPLGIESRDYLRSLIDRSNGTVHLIRVDIDLYQRTVAELFVPLKSNPEQEIHLNSAMIEAGYAWHYEQYSDNCPNRQGLEIAENIAKDKKVGVYSGNHQEPWLWRKANK